MTAIPADTFDPETRCSYCPGDGQVVVDVDEEYGYVNECPVCEAADARPPRAAFVDDAWVPTFLPGATDTYPPASVR